MTKEELIDWAEKDGYIKALNKYIQICEIEERPDFMPPGMNVCVTFRLAPYKVKGYDLQQTNSFECSSTFNLDDGTCEATVNGETIHLKAGEEDWRTGVTSDFIYESMSLEENIALWAESCQSDSI